MIRRREFITLLRAAGAAWPVGAWGQQHHSKVWRIGMLETTSEAQNAGNLVAFRESLRGMGYIEHQNYVITYRSADVHSERFASLAAELRRLGADIIVARGTPATVAAKTATHNVPIVMTSTAEPFAVVASIARPRGNVTGFSSLISDLASKRLELLKDLLPQFGRVAIMNDGRNPTLPSTIHAVHAAAQALKIEVKQYDVRKSEDFRAAFVTAQRDRVDAISMGTETITQANRKLIVELAGEYRIPVMYSSREFVDAGGLIVLGVNYQDLYRRSAIYVDKIFKGTKPGDLPIEQPTKFELVINLKTARALRITVPPTLLARADEVIE